jgi:hypothetical protein
VRFVTLKPFVITTLFVLCAGSVSAETYVCTAELSRYDRPGETEQHIFTRKSDRVFAHKTWLGTTDRDVSHENSSNIVMTHIDDSIGTRVFTIMIDKSANQFALIYFQGVRDAKLWTRNPPMWGECLLLD